MKKSLLFIIVPLIVIIMILMPSCTKETQKGTRDVLNLLPASTKGFVSVNIDSFASLDIYGSLIDEFDKDKEKKVAVFKDYQDFVARTGIDLKKDIHYITIGILGDLDFETMDKDKQVAAIVNLNYNRDKLLKVMNEEGVEYSEEVYKGIKIYLIKEKGPKNQVLSFLKEDTILLGGMVQVKTVIDVFKGERDNIHKSEYWKSYLNSFNSAAITAFMFEFPQKVKDKSNADQDSPFSVDLSKAELIKGFFDYKNNTWLGEIVLVSHNKEGNKKTVDLLNNLKGMGALAGEEIAELLNNINLVDSENEIKLNISISKDLFDKLKNKAKDKLKAKPMLDKNVGKEVEKDF